MQGISDDKQSSPVPDQLTTSTSEKPVAAQPPNSDFFVSFENLQKLKAGDFIECHTELGKIGGEVLVLNLKHNILLVRDNFGQKLHFLNLSNVGDRIRQLASSRLNPTTNLPFGNKEEAEKRLKRAEYQKSLLWVDGDVSKEARQAFNDLKKMFEDVTWSGKSIQVLKCVIVNEPFDDSSLECIDQRASSIQTLNHIKKILAQRHLKLHNSCVAAAPAQTITAIRNSPESPPSHTIDNSPNISVSDH